MKKNKILSYDEFVRQGVSISHICQQLYRVGLDSHELEKTAQRVGYIFVPGTRAYYLAEFIANVWIVVIMVFLSYLVSAVLSSFHHLGLSFGWLFISISIISSLGGISIYNSSDYDSGDRISNSERAYYLYSILSKKFPVYLKQITLKPA